MQMYDGLVLARFNQKFIRVFYKNVDALRYTRHKLLENIFNPRFILTALLWFAKYSPRFTDLWNGFHVQQPNIFSFKNYW